MANMMEKIGEKLHMGGHKKEEPHVAGHTPGAAGYGTTDPTGAHHTTAGYGAGYDPAVGHHAGPGVTPAGTAAPAGQGPMAKIKNKVKGKAHGEDSSSSSSSESDGEGGRRKKLGGKKKHGVF